MTKKDRETDNYYKESKTDKRRKNDKKRERQTEMYCKEGETVKHIAKVIE